MNKLLFLSVLLSNSLAFGTSKQITAGATSSSGDEIARPSACTSEMMVERSRQVADTIMTVNGHDAGGAYSRYTFSADENFFSITHIYDLGLSVPVYTVKGSLSTCEIFSVDYANWEG